MDFVQHAPCGHLSEELQACVIGRDFPSGCYGCPAYLSGKDFAERTRCEVWSRVMGYHRPVSEYNPGKVQEHRDRRLYGEPTEIDPVEI